jgi:hypothetical protein
MKTFQSGNETITIPDISVIKIDNPIVFRIEEGEWSGVMFTISDMHFDDEKESLLHYFFNIVDGDQPSTVTPDDIEKIVGNFILSIINDQVMKKCSSAYDWKIICKDDENQEKREKE